ncbi:uncharacterized protein LOC125047765 [Penaeus chinensis]|uniref:uncharacterized protein LOC125047765 n=1 Tax=Penaeus chinensis TaxID=139456 RepID=UPI001FB61301|nr:uncharacterized protein LOC125047765 [Penaeus chinensis]
MVCDCGSQDVPWGLIVLGILIGLAIVVCWFVVIVKSIRSQKRKNYQLQQITSVTRISILGSLYGLDSVVFHHPLETSAHQPTESHAHQSTENFTHEPPANSSRDLRSSEQLGLKPKDLGWSRSAPSSPRLLQPSDLPPPYSSLPPYPPQPLEVGFLTHPPPPPPPGDAERGFSSTVDATLLCHPPSLQPSSGPV